jgi:phospholipid/cholesterol/gamma-HCH transport system substrate-binding protein
MKKNTTRDIRVGALIAFGMVLIFGTFFIIGDQEGFFSDKVVLLAKFANIEGLSIGAPVRVGGMKVGSVRGIEFSQENNEKTIVVEMRVASASLPKIRKDSMARLGSMGLLGDRTVDITIGSPEQEAHVPYDFVNSIEAFQIDDLISESGDVLTDVKLTARDAREIAWKINHGDGSLAEIINDPRLYTNLDSLLVLWTDITKVIQSAEGSFGKFVSQPEFYDNMARLTNETADILGKINKSEGTLGKLANDESLYNHTDSLLVALTLTLEKINSGEGSMGQFINNAEVYDKLNTTLSSLDSLLVDLKENPGRYVKLSLF